MKIRTSYDYPPIPDRSMDWSAIDDDTYDGAPDSKTRSEIGFGRTESEAIEDLIERLDCYCGSCEAPVDPRDPKVKYFGGGYWEGQCPECHITVANIDPCDYVNNGEGSWDD